MRRVRCVLVVVRSPYTLLPDTCKAFSGPAAPDGKVSIVGGAQSSSSARPKFLTFAQSWSSALRRPANPITSGFKRLQSGFTLHLQRNHHAIYSFCHV